MAVEWKRVAVSDVCELIVDCVNKTAPVVEEPTPFKMLRTTNIKGGRIDRQECRRVSKDTFRQMDTASRREAR
jgi:type I restriction enzyme, S subunit